MKCPYCGKEMRAGYIQAASRGGGVLFRNKLVRTTIYLGLRKGDIWIGTSKSMWYNCAFFCEDCRCCITFVPKDPREEKWKEKGTAEPKTESEHGLECPYCGKEMRAGYIQSPGGALIFGDTVSYSMLYLFLREGDIRIARSRFGRYNVAFFCEDCRCCITFVPERNKKGKAEKRKKEQQKH